MRGSNDEDEVADWRERERGRREVSSCLGAGQSEAGIALGRRLASRVCIRDTAGHLPQPLFAKVQMSIQKKFHFDCVNVDFNRASFTAAQSFVKNSKKKHKTFICLL